LLPRNRIHSNLETTFTSLSDGITGSEGVDLGLNLFLFKTRRSRFNGRIFELEDDEKGFSLLLSAVAFSLTEGTFDCLNTNDGIETCDIPFNRKENISIFQLVSIEPRVALVDESSELRDNRDVGIWSLQLFEPFVEVHQVDRFQGRSISADGTRGTLFLG